jgi:hypothetical protein
MGEMTHMLSSGDAREKQGTRAHARLDVLGSAFYT